MLVPVPYSGHWKVRAVIFKGLLFPWTMQTIGSAFIAVAARLGEKPALVTDDAVITYKTLCSKALGGRSFLRDQGIQKGDHIAFFCPACPELVAFVLGNLLHGSVLVPINTHFKAAEVNNILVDSDIKVMLVGEKYLRVQPTVRLFHLNQFSGKEHIWSQEIG